MRNYIRPFSYHEIFLTGFNPLFSYDKLKYILKEFCLNISLAVAIIF